MPFSPYNKDFIKHSFLCCAVPVPSACTSEDTITFLWWVWCIEPYRSLLTLYWVQLQELAAGYGVRYSGPNGSLVDFRQV